MIIKILRTNKTADGIFGRLSLDWNPFSCYTIERLGEEIPVGTYPVEFTYSPHFNRMMPLVNVPGREGIRIHWGNIPVNYQGCIGVGDRANVSADSIDNTVTTFNQLYSIISLQAGLSLSVSEVYTV